MKHKKNTPFRYTLRHERRAWGLTQGEMASLMGLRSANHVSRIENGKKPPSLKAAFACQVIFGIHADALFPQVYNSVEEETMRNIYSEYQRLEHTTNPAGMRKGELYNLALSRAVARGRNLRRL